MELPALRDELRSAMVMNGALFAKIFGLLMMQMLRVDNLDSLALVSYYIYRNLSHNYKIH